MSMLGMRWRSGLFTNSGEISMYKRILVATDGSELSEKAVDSAIGLASQMGAELFAVKVIHRAPADLWDGSAPLLKKALQNAELEKQWAEHAQAIVDAVKASAQAKSVKATALTVKSDQVAEGVIGAATRNECDLIVMASHGRRGLSRILLGSETQHVLTHSHIPVLVLR